MFVCVWAWACVCRLAWCHHVINSYPSCHQRRGFAHPTWPPAPAHVSVEGCSPPSPVWAAGGMTLENSSLPVTSTQKYSDPAVTISCNVLAAVNHWSSICEESSATRRYTTRLWKVTILQNKMYIQIKLLFFCLLYLLINTALCV